MKLKFWSALSKKTTSFLSIIKRNKEEIWNYSLIILILIGVFYLTYTEKTQEGYFFIIGVSICFFLSNIKNLQSLSFLGLSAKLKDKIDQTDSIIKKLNTSTKNHIISSLMNLTYPGGFDGIPYKLIDNFIDNIKILAEGALQNDPEIKCALEQLKSKYCEVLIQNLPNQMRLLEINNIKVAKNFHNLTSKSSQKRKQVIIYTPEPKKIYSIAEKLDPEDREKLKPYLENYKNYYETLKPSIIEAFNPG